MTDQHNWNHAHEFETSWWGRNGFNTYAEERKQFKYAKRIGLELLQSEVMFFNLHGKSVLDIGGGVTSLLLKCTNRGYCAVLDPLPIPNWCKSRYEAAEIDYIEDKAEDLVATTTFDEVWIYNVLQHVQNPQKIIENAKKAGKLIRIFEWIDTPPHPGHPVTLKEKKLNDWLGGSGKVEDFSEDLEMGYNRGYYGVFPTPLYGNNKTRS